MEYTEEVEVSLQILEALDCPRSLTVALMLRYRQYDDLVTLRAIPENYVDHKAFFRAYQATRLLQKSRWLPTSHDRKARAIIAFKEAESKCKLTNELFESWSAGLLCFRSDRVRQQLLLARRKVHSLLRGENPYAFLDFCGFGPGADSSTRKGLTAAYDKLTAPGQVTRGASQFVDFLVQNSSLCTGPFNWDPLTRSINIDRVIGNKVTFVPKDCKTDRSIAVEPRWNIFLQKGVGSVLRRILRKKAGIDLDDQSRNQDLARVGSLTGFYSTIDLKSASDTVSFRLVEFLLPERWRTVLNALRSPYYFLEGKWHKAEKWSSMGNGYTFELESLVFHALVWSVCGVDHSVYGDDLIIPEQHFDEVVELLNFAGFSVNEEKSFHAGPFRESCGADYFNGYLVTPIYWKDPLDVEGTLRLVNQVSVLATRVRGDRFRDRRFRGIWTRLVKRLPESRRFFGPSNVASVVHDSLEKWAKPARWGWDGWELKAPVHAASKLRFREYSTAVLSQWFQPSSDGYSVRGRTRLTYKTIFVPTGLLLSIGDVGTWA